MEAAPIELKPVDPSLAPEGARCGYHPDRPAVAICNRCGTFVCRYDRLVYEATTWCDKCAELPEVEWLESYRRSLVGKRSVVVLAVELAAMAQLLLAVGFATLALQPPRGLPVLGAIGGAFICVMGAANGVAFSRRWRLARVAVLVNGALWIALALGTAAVDFTLKEFGAMLFMIALSGGPAGIIVVVAMRAPRTRLFFSLPVSRRELVEDYRIYGDNPAAQWAMGFGIIGLVVPFFFLLAFALAIRASRLVSPRSSPPVGRADDAVMARRLAVMGIVSTCAWLYFTHGFGLWS